MAMKQMIIPSYYTTLPHQGEEKGHVCFNTDLVTIKVNIKNAENIFKKALQVLEAEIPAPPPKKVDFVSGLIIVIVR